ncbi:uncharacterized protein JCM15063_002677 [Sporobolomyces koalae]|uniref:uncharacterized protein n=1 Tax=Sporobolomyces koalae TaxID=500713 RepID=UPI00317471E2
MALQSISAPRFLALPASFRRRSSASPKLPSSPRLPLPPSAHSTSHRPRRVLHLLARVASGAALALVLYSLALVSRPWLPSLRTRPPKVVFAAQNLTFTQYLESHFPLDLPPTESPHIWISLADHKFTGTGAANLDVFFKQLNVERKAFYGKEGRKVRESVFVTLCLDEGCAVECAKRDMYCYEGFESTRPAMIRKATWPKLASLIETLPLRDAFFVDADIGFRQDPYPHLEPLMAQYDLLAQENKALNSLNTGLLWLRRGPEIAAAWQQVLEMDLKADSRDQVNFNTVLDTAARRLEAGAVPGDETPLKNDFIASNGLSVHILDQRLFRTMHSMEDSPEFERHDSFVQHMTCSESVETKLYISKAQGYWSDVDSYYTQPPRLLSIENVAGTEGELSHYFKMFFAAAHYSGRAILPPTFVTVNEVADLPSMARHSPSVFPLAHLETAFGVTVLEPEYVEHAQAHLLGQSSLDQKKTRDDHFLTKQEQRRRADAAVSLARPSEIDLRTFRTFYSLVKRLLQPDLATSPHIRFVNADRSPWWGRWRFETLPIDHLRTCERLDLPWRCDEFCRGVDELKQGPLEEDWPLIEDINW